MGLYDIINGLLESEKSLDVSILPSQGLFYKKDFKLKIKKCKIEDIKEYENGYTKEIGVIINKIRNVVRKSINLSKGYAMDDIKSIDMVFIFLEIVKYTNSKPIILNYHCDIEDKEKLIKFNSDNFNYAKISEGMMANYNKELYHFEIDNYKYSLPTIGVEDSLAKFLIKKAKEGENIYNEYSYDFIYFLGYKNKLSESEVLNLIQIFNFDIDENEFRKISYIVEEFLPLQRYSLIKDDIVIDIRSKINLEKVWQ